MSLPSPEDLVGLDPACLRTAGGVLLWEPDGSWRARIEALAGSRLMVSAGPLWLDPLPSKVVYDAGEAARWVLRRWESHRGPAPEEWLDFP